VKSRGRGLKKEGSKSATCDKQDSPGFHHHLLALVWVIRNDYPPVADPNGRQSFKQRRVVRTLPKVWKCGCAVLDGHGGEGGSWFEYRSAGRYRANKRAALHRTKDGAPTNSRSKAGPPASVDSTYSTARLKPCPTKIWQGRRRLFSLWRVVRARRIDLAANKTCGLKAVGGVALHGPNPTG
jgi:hypothetical protein